MFLPGEFHGQRSLVGYSPWGRRESDMTKQLMLSLFITNPTFNIAFLRPLIALRGFLFLFKMKPFASISLVTHS